MCLWSWVGKISLFQEEMEKDCPERQCPVMGHISIRGGHIIQPATHQKACATDKAGVKDRNKAFNNFLKNDQGGTLNWILEQKEGINGKTGKIQIQSGVQLIVMHKCQAVSMGKET